MSFLGLILMIIEFVWCIAMPICGTLHLISSKYEQENKNKQNIMRHWCYYWICFILLGAISSFLSFLPSRLFGILSFVKVALLSVMATPRLQLPLTVFEFIQGKAAVFLSLKDTIVGFIAGPPIKAKAE